MKLFIFDEKHQKVDAELRIDDDPGFRSKLEEIISFLDEQEITSRYHRLVIAEKYSIEYEDGEPEVHFE